MRAWLGRVVFRAAALLVRLAAFLLGDPLAICCLHCVRAQVELQARIGYARGVLDGRGGVSAPPPAVGEA